MTFQIMISFNGFEFYTRYHNNYDHGDSDYDTNKTVLDLTPERSRLLHYVLGDLDIVKYYGILEPSFMEKPYKNDFKFPLVCNNIVVEIFITRNICVFIK